MSQLERPAVRRLLKSFILSYFGPHELLDAEASLVREHEVDGAGDLGRDDGIGRVLAHIQPINTYSQPEIPLIGSPKSNRYPLSSHALVYRAHFHSFSFNF